MTTTRTGVLRPRVRQSFAKLTDAVEIPYLIETQQKSYEDFLQSSVQPNRRQETGLQAAFLSIFPITSTTASGDSTTLEFVEYGLGKPKYTVNECIDRSMTYAAPLKVKFQLIVREVDKQTGAKHVKDIKEQEIYLGEIPLMTDRGTFVINGAERVIVSQLHRSPGVTFSEERHSSGRPMFYARVIPTRGAWLEFEVDANDLMYVSIDRRRKFYATTLLRAFGSQTDEEILAQFYPSKEISVTRVESQGVKVDIDNLEGSVGQILGKEVADPDTGKAIADAGEKITKKFIAEAREAGVKSVTVEATTEVHPLLGQILATDLVDTETGEVIAESKERITSVLLHRIRELNITKIVVLQFDPQHNSPILLNTLLKDTFKSQEEALVEFYRRIRPGNPPTAKAGKILLETLFYTEKRYNLGRVGRYRMNRKLSLDKSLEDRLLKLDDLVGIVRYLISLREGKGVVDDIDHLGNRRVRSVGELLENQIRIGLAAMERGIRERMGLLDIENVMPHNLINARPMFSAVRDFFGRSQLSQFMDQTNPLSELTHKRRLSALGPGGLNRDRAGFEVRDVHYTHYGRVCPVETPEGPNIGLISSLATFARINEFGFLESPYRKVVNGKVTDEIVYLSADEEDKYTIAQANEEIDEKGHFKNPPLLARQKGDFPRVQPEAINFMDVSPKQLVSVSAALVPFLEHDDANRALMGSNMQRQAVPLVRTDAPLVGTGIEKKAAIDSGLVVLAEKPGVVTHVSGDTIIVRESLEDQADYLPAKEHSYELWKYARSNQSTCMNQKPIVRVGDRVKKGQPIADGPSTDHGELALGRNVLCAFMPWGGYNFEDAILISEKVVKEDMFTSIHIEEFEMEARDTKLGREEITRDIPNLSEEALRNLDEMGIVRVGAEVHPNDILVGKITPKGETELSSEEKLLRAIFGEKAGDVLDTSLRLPPGVEGIVVGAKTFARKDHGTTADRALELKQIDEAKKARETKLRRVRGETKTRIELLLNQKAKSPIYADDSRKALYKPGDTVDAKLVDLLRNKLNAGNLDVTPTVKEALQLNFEYEDQQIALLDETLEKDIEHIKTGDELPPGVVKTVKVYVAQKRKLAVGDKLAGRHGNKGVVAKIMAEEDMPFLADGTPVEVVLNPLGVPSRMNVGQILETHLGWAARSLGIHIATPIFDGAHGRRNPGKIERSRIA